MNNTMEYRGSFNVRIASQAGRITAATQNASLNSFAEGSIERAITAEN